VVPHERAIFDQVAIARTHEIGEQATHVGPAVPARSTSTGSRAARWHVRSSAITGSACSWGPLLPLEPTPKIGEPTGKQRGSRGPSSSIALTCVTICFLSVYNYSQAECRGFDPHHPLHSCSSERAELVPVQCGIAGRRLAPNLRQAGSGGSATAADCRPAPPLRCDGATGPSTRRLVEPVHEERFGDEAPHVPRLTLRA
jgi:hypothetical protein